MAVRLRDEGVPAPEIGWEIMKDGQVAAQVELCWPKVQVGILLEQMPEPLVQWLQAEGWTLFLLDEAEMQRDRLRAAIYKKETA